MTSASVAATTSKIEVRHVMTNLVMTLRPSDSIGEAAKRLLTNRVSGAPVVEDGRVVGVASEADLLRAYTGRGNGSAASYPLMFLLLRGTPRPEADPATVGDVMTKRVVTIGPAETVWRAAALLDRHGVRRLPVVDDEGCLVGIVARADLVRYMAQAGDDAVAGAVEA